MMYHMWLILSENKYNLYNKVNKNIILLSKKLCIEILFFLLNNIPITIIKQNQKLSHSFFFEKIIIYFHYIHIFLKFFLDNEEMN